MIRENKEGHVESTRPKEAFVFVSEEPLPVMIVLLLKTEVAVLSITALEGLYLLLHTSMSHDRVCVRVCVYMRVCVCVCVGVCTCPGTCTYASKLK